MIERVRIVLLHHVAVRHETTGRPVARLRAGIVGGAPPGWVVVVRGGDVLVTGRDGGARPTEDPTLRIEAADPAVARRLAAPVAEIRLDAPALVHAYAPADMTLTVDLLDRQGAPRPDRAVSARAANGTRVDLTAVAEEPGTYRSASRQWGRGFHPLDLLVESTLARKLALDLTRADTRVRAVDPT